MILNNDWQLSCVDRSEAAAQQGKIKLALFSSGLGTINRGFEISTARFFRAITKHCRLDAKLFAGSDYPGTQKIWCVGRNKWLRFPLNLLPFLNREHIWKLAYALEQTSYSFGLMRESIRQWQPDVIWTKEVPLAHILYEFRRLSGKNYKIIFANGGGFRPKTYQQFDFIQHLHAEAYEEALHSGISASKMNVLPNLVPNVVSPKSKQELRVEYGYEQQDWIIICVAAWNSHHKRIDYLIEEVARLEDPHYKLLICGEPEPEAAALKRLAEEKLGSRVRFITTSESEVHELLLLADVFVLCSLYEGLGTVIIEAVLAGLPLLTHPHGGSRYILPDESWFVDMSKSGNLAERLTLLHDKPYPQAVLNELKQSVHKRFNEVKLSHEFEKMVEQVYMDGSQKHIVTSIENRS